MNNRGLSLIMMLIILLLLFNCGGGGKKLTGEFPETGIFISYKPSVGDTLQYKKESDILTEYYSIDYSRSSLAKSTLWQRMLIEDVKDNGEMTLTVFFDKEETGIFENNQYVPSKEESDIIGEYLTITTDSLGQLVKWEGLEGMGYDESGIDQGDQIASEYAAIGSDYFPNHPVKIGATWDKKTEATVSTEEGVTTQTTQKKYTLDDFVMFKGHKCAKLKINIIFTVSGEGEAEYEGDLISYWSDGKGDGKGDAYFDFENGYLVESELHWIQEFTITQVPQSTKEEQTISFYQEQTAKFTLITD
ncbi:hypothetical protein JW877_03550 [bacterium]|nr:hypothetical protein [bacterium]